MISRRKIMPALLSCILGACGAQQASDTSATRKNAATSSSRVDNPYSGVKGYVNPEWKANAESEPGGSRISNNPTGVWLDRIEAIEGSSTSMGLRAHLDAALSQGAGYIQFVIYNLPGRDCSALASNGQLKATEIDRYKSEYIDPIAEIMGDSKYSSLRIINIIEIDSLPNLITNVGSRKTATANCDTMLANGNYVTGVRYALSKLHAVPNTYNYIDAGHHGWIGWDDNFGPTVSLMASTVSGATGGFDTVQGFITNTANYSALVEPYLTLTESNRPSKWIDWNRYVDEKSYAIAFRTKAISAGFNSDIGMLIDTSRNGWGGSKRPTAAVTSGSIDAQVDGSRIDRRYNTGNWCNQSGAGIGERPQVVNSNGIDAYVWIKPPGESDGSSKYIENNEGKGFDGMCDPTYTGNPRNNDNMSGALSDAPISGKWFSAQFQELMANAYPPLSDVTTDPSYSMSASPSSLTVKPGASGTSTISISATGGFSSAVSLSASGVPSGVTASFSSTSATSSSTLTLSVSSSASVGTSTITVTGVGGGITKSTTISLTISNSTVTARVDNPYSGVKGYVNPEWKANAEAEQGGSRISNNPTGVWLDRIEAIEGSSTSMGLRAHLDEALSQGAGYIQFVIYNLPGRDCSALASNGQLKADEIDRYKSEYIDPIAEIMADSKYSSLRIINIIEIDSLPNLITNVGSRKTATANCDTMLANGNYVTGVRYALSKLHALPNTYNYIDAGHHGWIGWDDNFGPTVSLMASTVSGATGGFDTVQGFITNTANYSALVEPYLTITDSNRTSKWIDYNKYVDEKSYAIAFRTKAIAAGFNSDIGMLIDTSRNGWGGSNRPTAAVTSGSVDAQVDGSRIDRRYNTGNWCNQSGAGLGERPQVVNSNGIDAYVWIKPPGESDGSSKYIENDEGKGFDGMCDPTYTGNPRNNNNMSGALSNAPLSGKWFSAQFQELMANAYPPLSGGTTDPSYSMSASPSSLTVKQGSSGSSTISIAATGGFSSSVSLSVSGLPSGVTASFSSTSATSSSTLTFSASSSAYVGTSTVTVTGVGGGITKTASISLTISKSSTTDPSFSLTASPSSATVKQGSSGSATIYVSATGGFSSSVSLSVSGLPSGVSASFSPTSTSSSSTLTLSASSSATTGTSVITIVGTGGGITKSTSLTLTVSSGGGTTTYCSNPTDFRSGGPGTLNTANAACYRTTSDLRGWTCYNFDGRTVTVNGQTVSCGGSLPSKTSDGYYYFSVSSGKYPWAGFVVW